MVFGPALLEAIDLEKKKAMWPRVIVSDGILQKITEAPTIEDYVARLTPASVVDTSFEDWNRMKGALRQDNDGCYFVDYLKGGPRGGLSYSGYNLLRENILCMINDPENHRFWPKYEWLVQYFNTSVNESSLPNIEPIVPPELNPGK